MMSDSGVLMAVALSTSNNHFLLGIFRQPPCEVEQPYPRVETSQTKHTAKKQDHNTRCPGSMWNVHAIQKGLKKTHLVACVGVLLFTGKATTYQTQLSYTVYKSTK